MKKSPIINRVVKTMRKQKTVKISVTRVMMVLKLIPMMMKMFVRRITQWKPLVLIVKTSIFEDGYSVHALVTSSTRGGSRIC